MKINAIVIQRHGGPEVLEQGVVELPDQPPPGHVRVRVKAVALNHLDLWFRRGLPHLKLNWPHTLGSDFAGVIEALGPGATGPAPGTRVVVAPGVACGICEACQSGQDNMCREFKIFGEFLPGSYQELLDVPVANVHPVPGALTLEQAASIPLVFLTAWALVEKAQIGIGETVLIHAAGSGVSTAAIQLAKARGARVIATTSSEAKIAPAKKLGADEVILLGQQDFTAEVKRLTQKRGVEVVIDHVGGELFSKSLTVLASGGRIATCGATSGPAPAFDLNRTFMRYNSVLGTRIGAKRFLFPILRAFEAGTLKPVVHTVLPLDAENMREAHRMLEEREAFGKIVLRRG